MANRKIEKITPGSDQFKSLAFVLNHPLTSDNVNSFDFQHQTLTQIQSNGRVFAMPVYVTKKLNLMMIASPLVEGDWTIAFSKAKINQNANGQDEVYDLDSPITTGEGLNLLGQPKYSPNLSNKLLAYFSTLSDAKLGHWTMVNASSMK